MSTPYPTPVTAAQVGTYFVAQYYQLLQQQPEFVHQFYNDASTMLRIDGPNHDNATSLLQIHTLVLSLNYSEIEIRIAHSLESWNGGVLVMVSGSVALKDLPVRRKFVQTFFLAPQEKGYFVLNDVFYFIDDDPMHYLPTVLPPQNILDSKRTDPTASSEQAPNYFLDGEIQSREFIAPTHAKENGLPVDNYTLPEQRLQQASESETVPDINSIGSNGSLQNTGYIAQDEFHASVEEPIREPQKHTYASILRAAKRQSPQSVASVPSLIKNAPPTSDWNHASQSSTQQVALATNSVEKTERETVEEMSSTEEEDEILSVYVRNLSTTITEAEIEEEFKNFGNIVPDGVCIRSRKDVGVCYAFVEFEDMTGVHNAVKAGTAHVAGRQLFIEARRRNSYPFRVGRGRGRGSYPLGASRGRFGGRGFGRGGDYDGGNRDYIKSRGNGYYRSSARQDRE